MPTEKKLTGYPSIDKPWLKYYLEKNIDFDISKTIYNNFKCVASNNKNNLAVISFRTGEKITFGELLNKSDEFANGLTALGVSTNDKVVVLTLNSLIDPVIVLGTNKVGAVVEFLDPDSDIPQMKCHTLTAKVLIVEGVFQPLAKLICNSTPVVVYNSSTVIKEENFIDYIEFIKNGTPMVAKVNEDIDLPTLIIFSSGSTGAPKPIVHSNYSVNNAIKIMLLSDFPLNAMNFMTKTIPSHIGLGVVTSMLVALMAGMPQIILGTIDESVFDFENDSKELIAMLTVKETFDLMIEYNEWRKINVKDNHYNMVVFAAPIFFKIFLSQNDKIPDMSFITGILLGGSKMTTDELKVMEKVFGEKGLSVPIGIGYGQNELCGAVALNTVNHNKNGSAGYPVLGTNVRIVDRDTYKDVTYNQIGLILEQSDSCFLYYDNMPEETEKTKIVLSDGTKWYNSNDLGYMDEAGFLFITGRTNRVVIKSDHKVSLDVVEAKIKGISGVVDVAVVPYHSGNQEGDTVAFIVLNDNSITLTLDDINNPKYDLTIFEIPVKIKIVEELPRMNNGKVDYQGLEKEAEQLQ